MTRLYRARVAMVPRSAAVTAAVIAFAAGVGVTFIPAALRASMPVCELVAIDSRGGSHVLGSGDDSAAAWTNAAPAPDDWRELRLEGGCHD